MAARHNRPSDYYVAALAPARARILYANVRGRAETVASSQPHPGRRSLVLYNTEK